MQAAGSCPAFIKYLKDFNLSVAVDFITETAFSQKN
jgi:hypothetical protein